MKKIVLCFTGIFFLCTTCRKEHVAPVNQLVKDLFCFKVGSEWTYYDSVSQTTQKMVVIKYETFESAPEPKGGKKAYDFAELIKMEILIGDSKKRTQLESGVDQDNTLKGLSWIYTPTGEPLHIHCDENNNFTPSATYLDTYSVNGTTYHSVYVFGVGGASYYVSKHNGFIRCEKIGKYDLVLINKNIQQ